MSAKPVDTVQEYTTSSSAASPLTRTAKSDLLSNSDVLAYLFAFLEPDGIVDRERLVEARKDLLSASLVCSSFRDPALDCLWRFLDSLVPLLRLLPGIKQNGKTYVSLRSVSRPPRLSNRIL